jgi:hypothetical protein
MRTSSLSRPPTRPALIEERYDCLGTWQETIPTDRTHIEVTQSAMLSIEAAEEEARQLRLKRETEEVTTAARLMIRDRDRKLARCSVRKLRWCPNWGCASSESRCPNLLTH